MSYGVIWVKNRGRTVTIQIDRQDRWTVIPQTRNYSTTKRCLRTDRPYQGGRKTTRRRVMKQLCWAGIRDMEDARDQTPASSPPRLPNLSLARPAGQPIPPDGILGPNLHLSGTLGIRRLGNSQLPTYRVAFGLPSLLPPFPCTRTLSVPSA